MTQVPVEFWALFIVLAFGLIQAALLGGETVDTARKNFNATFPLFGIAVVALAVIDGFGRWSENGVLLYAAARIAYLPLSFGAGLRVRKYVWALSIAGLIGCIAQLGKELLS